LIHFILLTLTQLIDVSDKLVDVYVDDPKPKILRHVEVDKIEKS
jgi:hypothetical protein